MNAQLTIGQTYTLSFRQEAILSFVTKEINEKHIPPTRVEIARHFGFKSANAAEEHLRALAKKGFIQLIPHTSRGIKIIPQPAVSPSLSAASEVANVNSLPQG